MRDPSAEQRVSRRQILAGGATLASGATLLALVPRESEAVAVDVTEIAIPDQTESAAAAPESVQLELAGEWQVGANVVPDQLKITPRAQVTSSAHGWTEFDPVSFEVNSKQASGEVQLTRDLLMLMSLRDVFPAESGKSVDREIQVALDAVVLKDNSEIGSATAKESFVLTMSHEEASGQVGFSVDGAVTLQ